MDRTTMDFPFDVLGIIFDYYLDNETIYFPLETMLLVCRSWNVAAVGHRNLWGRLKIYIGHSQTQDIWRSRLPRRLERAGDSTLLEIDLRSMLGSSNPQPRLQLAGFDLCSRRKRDEFGRLSCGCAFAAHDTIKGLLGILTGPHGELCHRWKSLYLFLTPYIVLQKELAYPTPNLEAVWLEQPAIAHGLSILPSIPKLETFEIFRISFSTLPKVENVRNLVILDLCSWSVDLSNLKTAIKVETLTIGARELPGQNPIPYSLPQFLPHLFSMSFIGDHLPSNLNKVQAPNIRRLSLTLAKSETLQTFIDSSLPLWNLQELELTLPNTYLYLIINKDFRTVISDLLLSCINLTRIKGDRRSLSVIVKLYREEWATKSAGRDHITGKTLSFWFNDLWKEVSVKGPEGKSELVEVAMSLGLIPPIVSWEYMLRYL